MIENRVISPYSAIVNGKETGLAGCANSRDCTKAAECLRSSLQLRYRVQHRASNPVCQYLIPLVQQA